MAESIRRAQAIWIESRKRWQIKVQKEGIRKTFTSKIPGKRGKTAAEKAADNWDPEAPVQAPAAPEPRFWPTYEQFLADAKVRASEGYYANLDSIGRTWLKPQLEHLRLTSLSQQHWQNCINAAIQKKRSKKTLKNIRGTISAFCRFCRKSKLEVPPTTDLDIPKNAPVGKRVILQPEQLRIVFSDDTTLGGQPSFFIHAFRFIILSGVRRGEALALSERTDIKGDVVHIQQSLNKFGHLGPTKTPKSNRRFVLNRHMKAELAAQKAMLRKMGIISPWVFPDENGQLVAPATFYDRWCEYCEYHGFKTTLHELRHLLISIAKSRINEDLLKPMVGHTKSMDTYGVYGQEVTGEQQLVADELDALFTKILKEETPT